MDIMTYMHTIFIDSIRKCFNIGGFATNENGEESGGQFLIGYKGNLFKIHNDYQIGISINNYEAIGCGEQFCLGSLYSTENMNLSIEERIILALKSAEQFHAAVHCPFIIKSITNI
jgi:hypothetical protein